MISALKRYLGAVVAVSIVSVSATALAQDMPLDRLSASLDRLATRLALLLGEPATRALLLRQVEASKDKVVPLQEALGAALAQKPEPGSQALAGLAAQVQQIEAAMARGGMRVPRLDLSLPVPAHAGLLGTSETIYVVAGPLAEESEARTLTGYSKAERVTLDANQPPTVPTLVVGPAERESWSQPTPFRSPPSRERK